ncbi:leucine rich repeat [Cichlidogyrus casuarinus]|uniref:Leucine rich repeat n=1 Tax=Cichlidogyrus casuarinus TaxID=1844966 RepID=A0ABD2Q5S8_9PLAT
MLDKLKIAYEQCNSEKMDLVTHLGSAMQKFHYLAMSIDSIDQATHQFDKTVHSKFHKYAKGFNGLKAELHQLKSLVLSQKHQINAINEEKTRLDAKLRESEKDHKAELATRVKVNSVEFEQLMKEKLEKFRLETKFTIEMLQDKSYNDLESEFRQALIYEAKRYNGLCAENAELQNKTEQLSKMCNSSEEENKQKVSIIADLTEVVKVIKLKLSKQNDEYATELTSKEVSKANVFILPQNRISQLESILKDSQERAASMGKIKSDSCRLQAELQAKESIIKGLRAERQNWSEELAKQGTSLARDRGYLEAKIQTLEQELITTRKTLQHEMDSLKIKTKIIDDQTDSIKSLKNVISRIASHYSLSQNILEHLEEKKQLISEQETERKSLLTQIDAEKGSHKETLEKLDKVISKKESLKELLREMESRETQHLNELKTKQQSLEKRGETLELLEKKMEQVQANLSEQVEQLRGEKEELLRKLQSQEDAINSLDAKFRLQIVHLEQANQKIQISYEDELFRAKNEAQLQMAKVEDEMRHVLMESEATKSLMRAKFERVQLLLSGDDLGHE